MKHSNFAETKAISEIESLVVDIAKTSRIN